MGILHVIQASAIATKKIMEESKKKDRTVGYRDSRLQEYEGDRVACVHGDYGSGLNYNRKKWN